MTNYNQLNNEISRIYSILDREHNKLRWTNQFHVKLSIPVNGVEVWQDLHSRTSKAKLLPLAQSIYTRSFKIKAMYDQRALSQTEMAK